MPEHRRAEWLRVVAGVLFVGSALAALVAGALFAWSLLRQDGGAGGMGDAVATLVIAIVPYCLARSIDGLWRAIE